MFPISATRSARSRTAVVMCCDANYLPFALAAMEQISNHSPDRDFDFCLVSSQTLLGIPPSLAHLDVRSCLVKIGDTFDGLRLDAGRTPDIYVRLALPSIFEADYDRILYMDSDIFVQGGDFTGLLKVDMGGHAIAAIRDNIQWRTPNRRAPQFRKLGIPARPYFNAGILMMDVARYNATDILGRAVALGRANADKMIRHDQNLYNSILQGDWAELSPVWNWQYTWSSRMLETLVDANVVHFIGNRKPWNHTGGEFPLRYRRFYRAFIARHFPERPLPPEDGLPPARNEPFLRKMLVKHLLSHRAMVRYLSRFPTELTVHK